MAIRYGNSNSDAALPGRSGSKSVRIVNTTAVAKHYNFQHQSVFSAEGSNGSLGRVVSGQRFHGPETPNNSKHRRSNSKVTLGADPKVAQKRVRSDNARRKSHFRVTQVLGYSFQSSSRDFSLLRGLLPESQKGKSATNLSNSGKFCQI